MIKILELFSGNADITNYLNNNYVGLRCYSVDYEKKYNADYCVDVYSLSNEFLKQFDFIWLSPDCTTYSLASHGVHRKKGGFPVSSYAFECDRKNYDLISRLKYLDIPFIIENPRAHFRHRDFVKGLDICTVYYSTYGAPSSKPTDFFSNRSLKGRFNCDTSFPKVHLDYCFNYSNFLGRCKIPQKLLENICDVIVDLINEEYHVNNQGNTLEKA